MKKNLRLLAGAVVGAAVSLSLTSCYYDPNYSSASVGGSYSSGYGDGYGYGGSGFSTSVFVSTGNPQWGYDPNCYSYYDYHRHAYYDPYLNGYYPVGYRPPVVYGVPHPYGWHRGGGYIRPPVYVSNVTVRNYQNRATLYQGTHYGWARQVRQQSPSQGRINGSHPSQGYNGSSSRQSTATRSSTTRTSTNSYNSKTKSKSGSQTTRQGTNKDARKQGGTLPSRYNTPVKSSDKQARQGKNGGGGRQQAQRTTGSHPQAQKGKASKENDKDNQRASRYR